MTGRPCLFYNLPLPSQFLHRYQIMLLSNKQNECEQLVHSCDAALPDLEFNPRLPDCNSSTALLSLHATNNLMVLEDYSTKVKSSQLA